MKKRQNHPAPQPQQPSSEKESTNRHVYIEPGVKVDLVDDLKKQLKTNQGDNTTQQNKSLFWTKIAAGVLLIYTFLTGWLGLLTRESIDNNTRQFQIDQRPYVWTSNVLPQFKATVNQKLWANIHLINYGKSPALKTSITGLIFVGANAKNDAEQWFKGDMDKAFSDPGKTEIVIPPGIPPPIPDNPLKATFGSGVFTLMSQHPLTQPDVDYVATHEEAFVVVARLQYFDGFGNRYWSDICISKFLNGSMPFCEKHNDIN